MGVRPAPNTGGMVSMHLRLGRAVALLATLTCALGSALVTGVTAPADAVISGNVLSGTASPMWQTNNTVHAVLVSGNTIYAGGQFTQVRPPGTSAGSNQSVNRAYLAAFNATTGALVTTFNANVGGGQVKSLAMSPDGSRLYVGGGFTSVGGQARNRVAAVNPTTGALVTGFNPNVELDGQRAGRDVIRGLHRRTVHPRGWAEPLVDRVAEPHDWRGQRRVLPRAGPAPGPAVHAGLRQLPRLGRAGTKPAVTAIATDAAGTVLLVGGNFVGTNGDNAGGMAKLDPTTGATRPGWRRQRPQRPEQPINTNCAGRVSDIAISGRHRVRDRRG